MGWVSGPRRAELEAILAAPLLRDSGRGAPGAVVTGRPESTQFIDRLLPGAAKLDRYDNMPTHADFWEADDGDGQRTTDCQEVARAFPGVRAGPGVHQGMAPITTKAGGRLWSVSFVSPAPAGPDSPGPAVTTCRASYPLQLLVRYDERLDVLAYDMYPYPYPYPSTLGTRTPTPTPILRP